jgi:hypothetical protein
MSTADVTTAAAVIRLIQALQVLKEASPDLLVPHADALSLAQEAIAELAIEAEQRAELRVTALYH